MDHFQPQQAFTNTVAKRASSGELNRWRDSGVDPELLRTLTPAVAAVVTLELVSDLPDRQSAGSYNATANEATAV